MQSYLSQPAISVLLTAENEERKYSAASVARRAHFTPLCFSVDGVAGPEAAFFEETCILPVCEIGEIIG